MAKLLCETSFDTLVECANDGKDLYITGIYASSNKENRNGRKYRKSTLEREIEKLQESIGNKTLRGESDHPRDRANTLLERAAIMITELHWQGDDVIGKSLILDTDHGRNLKAILDKGNIGISSRGLGTVDSNGWVNENYKMLTFDAVGNASNFGSTVMDKVYEDLEFPLPEEIEAKRLEEAANNDEFKKEKLRKLDEENLLNAKKVYKQHIWQVLKTIEKSI